MRRSTLRFRQRAFSTGTPLLLRALPTAVARFQCALLLGFSVLLPSATWAIDQDDEAFVGVWLFDDGEGSDIVEDEINGNDGVINGVFDWDDGAFGEAIVATGGGSIDVSNSESLATITDELTVAAWFRVDVDSDTGVRKDGAFLLEDQSGSEPVPNGFSFRVWTDRGISPGFYGQTELVQGEWYHVAGTYDGETVELYINGEPESELGALDAGGLEWTPEWGGQVSPGSPLQLKFGPESFTGGIDEVMILNRALDEDEILELMEGWEVLGGPKCDGELEAVIQATPPRGEAPLEVAFDGTQSRSTGNCGAITRYEWEIDGGDPVTGAQVSHRFERFGNKEVELKVTTDNGNKSKTAVVTVPVDFRKSPVPPWTSVEIGDARVTGGARLEDGCLVLGAGGRGVVRRRDDDAIQFVYVKITGDFSVSARVRGISLAPGSESLGAIMARAGTEPDSPFTMVGIRQRDDVLQAITRRRTRAGRLPLGRSPTEEETPPAFYVRLDRVGDEFSFFSSTDGTNWENLDTRTREVDLPDEALVGLIASAEDASERENREHTVEVTFCELNGFPIAPSTGFRRGDADDNGAVQLTDAVGILNFLFSGGTKPTCDEAADADNNGAVQLTDAVFILDFLFGGGATPQAPGVETCGPDPEPDDATGCDSYTSC